MVKKIMIWLEGKKWLTLFLLIAYFLAVVLPHEIIGKIIAQNLDIPMGRDRYNQMILALAGGGLLVYLGCFIYGFRKLATERKKLGIYLITTLLLIVVAINTLLVVNVELIHIVQYAVAAILLFPILRNYGSTIFWIAILGTIDEAYQYFVLAPFRTDYFDFNDVIIDILGGGMGLIFLKAMGIEEKKAYELFRSPIVVGAAILTVFFTYLFRHDYLSVYPVEQIGGLPLLLIRRMEETFWNTSDSNFVKFHVIQPLEGIILIVLLLIFYKFLGKTPAKKTAATPTISNRKISPFLLKR